MIAENLVYQAITHELWWFEPLVARLSAQSKFAAIILLVLSNFSYHRIWRFSPDYQTCVTFVLKSGINC